MKQLSATFETLFAKTVTKNLAIIAVSWAILATTSTYAAVLTVTNVNDSGPGSLRQAIDTANQTPGPDTIAFNIGASGLKTITPQSMLPAITDPVIIDGTTQPGFAGKPIIELNGSSAGSSSIGLTITAGNCTVLGLVINRFGSWGVHLDVNGGNIIQGNFIGTDATGTIALGNSLDGVSVEHCGNNLIGGTTAAAGNLLSGNARDGLDINFSGATSNVVQGNLIGTDFSGANALANGRSGVSIFFGAQGSLVGGTVPGARNVISGNGGDGVLIGNQNGFPNTSDNIVQGNFIGTDASGTGALGNRVNGVNIFDNAASNTIGGTTASAGNIIFGNSFNGISITSSTAISNVILSNSIYGNGAIGIDLNGDGVTSNDSGDIDTGPNNLQNYPVLTSVTDGGGNTSIAGTLNSIANTTYRIEFFANDIIDPSGFGEGQSFVGFTDATTDASGNLSFNMSVPQIAAGQRVTATATDPSGNTSEFSSPTAAPMIISSPSATGRTGSPFNFQVITAEGSSATRLSATGLPPGLSVDSLTGEISGTSTTDGVFLVTLTVTEGSLTNSSTLELTFTSDLAVPVIVSPNSAFLYPGLPFSYTIVAPSSDSSDPITYSVVGLLPPGLGLDSATGIIAGTPELGFGLQPMPALAGGVVTNVQIFACNSSGCAAQGLDFLLPNGAANISTRLSVGTGDNVLIGGFITVGNAPMKLVLRGIGPSIPVGGVLPNPYLELHSGPTILAENDNWKDNLAGGSQELAIQNSGLPPTNDLESAILSVLDPGPFTAIMRGANTGTGVGLVEVYNLGAASMDVSSEAHLANISTRGFVQTGDDVMIGGFINQGAVPIKVLVRGIGPSLTPFGVIRALANPTLELHNPDTTVITNDNWTTDPTQKANIMATGLAPANGLESAILLTLPVGQGAYTAIVHGVGDTTGVALVEAYFGNPCLGTVCP